jgi:hypothetical protein
VLKELSCFAKYKTCPALLAPRHWNQPRRFFGELTQIKRRRGGELESGGNRDRSDLNARPSDLPAGSLCINDHEFKIRKLQGFSGVRLHAAEPAKFVQRGQQRGKDQPGIVNPGFFHFDNFPGKQQFTAVAVRVSSQHDRSASYRRIRQGCEEKFNAFVPVFFYKPTE